MSTGDFSAQTIRKVHRDYMTDAVSFGPPQNKIDRAIDSPVQQLPVTFTGPFAANQTVNLQYRQVGEWCFLTFPGLSAAAGSPGTSTTITSTTNLPIQFQPNAIYGTTFQYVTVGQNNSAQVLILVNIQAKGTGTNAGLITMSLSPTGGNFTNSGNGGWSPFTISYLCPASQSING